MEMINKFSEIYSLRTFLKAVYSLLPDSKFAIDRNLKKDDKTKRGRDTYHFYSIFFPEVIAEEIKSQNGYKKEIFWGTIGKEKPVKKYIEYISDVTNLMKEKERLKKELCKYFTKEECKILKNKVIDLYFLGCHIFREEVFGFDKETIYVTTNGYFENLDLYLLGKECEKKIVEKVIINGREKCCKYEELEDIHIKNPLLKIEMTENGTTNLKLMSSNNVDEDDLHSKYDIYNSESRFAKAYLRIQDDLDAIICVLLLICCGKQISDDLISLIFPMEVNSYNTDTVENIISAFEDEDFDRVYELLVNIDLSMGNNVDREFYFCYYIAGILLDMNSEKYYIEGAENSMQCFEKCCELAKKISDGYEFAGDIYIGASCKTMAEIEYNQAKKTGSLSQCQKDKIQKYVDIAKKSGYKGIYKLLGDFYSSDENLGLYGQDLVEACINYKKAGTEDGNRRAWDCIKRINENEPSRLRELHIFDSLCDFEREAVKGGVKEVIEKFCLEETKRKIHAVIKGRISPNDAKGLKKFNQKNNFVILGYSEYTDVFLDSLCEYDNCNIIVLDYHVTSEECSRINSKSRKIEIYKKDISSLLETLNVYCMDYKENIVPEKVHFIALNSDKMVNVSFVVEVMSKLWEKHLIYEELNIQDPLKITENNKNLLLSDYIDFTIDISDEQAQMYIDGFQKMAGDFLVPVKYVSYDKEIIHELLLKYPLFLPSLKKQNSLNNYARNTGEDVSRELKQIMEEEKCNIIILGDSQYIPSIVKSILSIFWFGRNDDEKLEDIEAIISKRVSLTLVGKNADKFIDKIKYDAPDIFKEHSYAYCKPVGYSYDVLKTEFSDIFERDRSLLSEKQIELKDRMDKSDYYICAMDDDTKGISLAIKIREMCFRKSIYFNRHPEISVLCKNALFDKLSAQARFSGGNWMANYNINTFGTLKNCYSYENLFENVIDDIAFNTHCAFYGNKQEAMNSFYSSSYNRNSSEMAALYSIYRLYSAHVFDDMTDEWNIDDIIKEISGYLFVYDNYICDEKQCNRLAIYEHIRWRNQMQMNGFSQASVLQANGYLERGNREHMLKIAKLHPYIASWNDLGDRSETVCIEAKKHMLAHMEKCSKKYQIVLKDFQIYLKEKINLSIQYSNSCDEYIDTIVECYRSRGEYLECLVKYGRKCQEYHSDLVNKLKESVETEEKAVEFVEEFFSCLQELDMEYISLLDYIKMAFETIECEEDIITCKDTFLENCRSIRDKQKRMKECYSSILEYHDNEGKSNITYDDKVTAKFMENVKKYSKTTNWEKLINLVIELMNQYQKLENASSTGIQSWIDELLLQKDINPLDNSIHEGNRQMIKSFSDTIRMLDAHRKSKLRNLLESERLQ